MKTPYIIEADSSEAEIETAEQGTLILAGVTMRGRKLLAQDIDARRVVELGEAYTEILRADRIHRRAHSVATIL